MLLKFKINTTLQKGVEDIGIWERSIRTILTGIEHQGERNTIRYVVKVSGNRIGDTYK